MPSSENPNVLELMFSSHATDVVVEKEVLLYDGNNLVADVGGFLGLLVGYSILGEAKDMEKYFRKQARK